VSEMGWTETHRRWNALQEIEARANAGSLDALPWTEEYADLFGDSDRLVAALRSRWEHARRAQLDSHLPEPVLEEQWRRLRARHAGVLRLLERHGDLDLSSPDLDHATA
jgi:hypothetical protein